MVPSSHSSVPSSPEHHLRSSLRRRCQSCPFFSHTFISLGRPASSCQTWFPPVSPLVKWSLLSVKSVLNRFAFSPRPFISYFPYWSLFHNYASVTSQPECFHLFCAVPVCHCVFSGPPPASFQHFLPCLRCSPHLILILTGPPLFLKAAEKPFVFLSLSSHSSSTVQSGGR